MTRNVSQPKLSFFLGSIEERQRGRDFDSQLARIRELGYEGVEFMATEPDDFNASDLKRSLERASLQVSAFLTGGIYMRHGSCFASADPEVRRAAVHGLANLMPAARETGALLVLGMIQGRRTDNSNLAEAQENIVSCLKQVAGEAERHGVICVFEPVNHLEVGFNHTVADAMRIVEKVGSPSVRIMADTFHLNIEESSPDKSILACGPNLTHFHLCETNRQSFGSGHLDFRQVFIRLEETGYRGYCTVITEYGEHENWESEAATAKRVISLI